MHQVENHARDLLDFRAKSCSILPTKPQNHKFVRLLGGRPKSMVCLQCKNIQTFALCILLHGSSLTLLKSRRAHITSSNASYITKRRHTAKLRIVRLDGRNRHNFRLSTSLDFRMAVSSSSVWRSRQRRLLRVPGFAD